MMFLPSRAGTKWLMRWCYVVLAAALLPLAHAAISVNHTRLIVTEQEREASPQILNEGARPVLIQAWVDTGEAQMQVEQIRAAFIIDPPVFRLEPGQSRRLRVLMVQPVQTLPRDRESVFWFNALEIPPKPNADDRANHLQVSFRTRLKIFFRPDPVARHVLSESDVLNFALRRESVKKVSLNIRNPSPLHQTLNALTIIDPKNREVALVPVMVGPRQTMEIPLSIHSDEVSGATWRVHFSTIDNFGAVHDQEEAVFFD